MSDKQKRAKLFTHASAVLVVLSALTHVPAKAGVAESVAACKAIPDDEDRLKCFDEISVVVKPAQADTGVSPTVAAGKATPSVVLDENFGAPTLPKAPIEQPKVITASLVGKVDGISQGKVFLLDNGQRWKVTDDRSYDYVGDNSPVKLDRNLIGSYWMKFTDGGPRFKVRRIH